MENTNNILTKICPSCKKTFTTRNKRKVYCNSDCKIQFMKTDEYKQRLYDIKVVAMNKPGTKEKQSKAISSALRSPEINKKLREGCKVAQNRPEIKEKLKLARKLFNSSIEGQELNKEYSERMKILWSDDSFRQKQQESMKVGYQNPAAIKNLSKNKLDFWANVDNTEKMFISRYKDYMLPSGKIVKIQGYEDKAITFLLNKKYNESDLIISDKEIFQHIGPVYYLHNNKKHRYIPDIFIKSENKIIEVKSPWSYKLHFEINQIKKNACLELNFKFDFLVIDANLKTYTFLS